MEASGGSGTVREAVQEAVRRLAAVSETPRLDAELLLAHVLGLTRAQLLARLRDAVPIHPAFEEAIQRRLNHEPIAYITGTWEFFSMEFAVRAPMLVPRPETEDLVQAALDYCANHFFLERGPRILDLCTGTGCVGIALARHDPNASVTACDIAPYAVDLARENAQRHHAAVEYYQGDLFAALPPDAGPFDVIVSNPPYVAEGEWETLSPVIQKHEDPGALLAGVDGLSLLRRIIDEAPAWLRTGGLLAVEMGETQAREVEALLRGKGYREIIIRHDLAGHPRIAQALTA